jgi:ABC-type polar amino acid transport system ATPase subunit
MCCGGAAESDGVYFMSVGVILEHGPPEQIFRQPRDERTRGFLEHVL